MGLIVTLVGWKLELAFALAVRHVTSASTSKFEEGAMRSASFGFAVSEPGAAAAVALRRPPRQEAMLIGAATDNCSMWTVEERGMKVKTVKQIGLLAKDVDVSSGNEARWSKPRK